MKHMKFDVCVYDYFNGKYPMIVEGMLCDEFYILQDRVYDFCYELCYYGKVVGFVCGDFSNGLVVCDLCYILPRFRGLGLFVDGVNRLNELFDIDVCLHLPNSFAVESLLSHKYAVKLNSHLVLSLFPLSFTVHDKDMMIYSRLYDTDACAIVSLKEKMVSPLLDVDAEYNNPHRFIDDEYFSNIKNELLDKV